MSRMSTECPKKTKRKRTVSCSPRRRCIIYGLVDPSDLLVHYVGLSSRGLKRPREHRLASDKSASPDCGRWVAALQSRGLDFDIVILEEVETDTQLQTAERWWIAYGRLSGWPLTNRSSGGAYSRRFRRPGFGVPEEELAQAGLVNFCNLIYKSGDGELALRTAERCLSLELFEWFKAAVFEHHLIFSPGWPPYLCCPCGYAVPLFTDASLPEAVESMNVHIRSMSQLRNDEASRKREWMLHLS